MNADIPQDLLLRLSLDELEKGGKQALQTQNYPRAYQLLREAIRRAPFRSDLRTMLSAAVEGRMDAAPAAKPQDHSTLEAMRMAPRSFGAGSRGVMGRPKTELDDAPEETQPNLGGAMRPQRKIKPGQFERRHRRGPISALILGAYVGVILMCILAAGGWFYLQRRNAASAAGKSGTSADAAGDGSGDRARMEQAFTQADAYLSQNSFSLAIERLNTLPKGRERDDRLAAIYMKIGDQGFQQDPPRLPTALDAYSKAVEYAPDNPDDGVALAQVYYSMAGGRAGDIKGDDAKANLDHARQTLQAVIDRNPDCVAAYQLMVKVGTAQRDPALQQKMLRKIIDIVPKGSEDEINARDGLLTLGFKIDG